jgi:hypothetical protein
MVYEAGCETQNDSQMMCSASVAETVSVGALDRM